MKTDLVSTEELGENTELTVHLDPRGLNLTSSTCQMQQNTGWTIWKATPSKFSRPKSAKQRTGLLKKWDNTTEKDWTEQVR